MTRQPGEIELAGTLAGPEAQWPLRERHLAEALEQAGLPAGSLRLIQEGGRLTIEPGRTPLPAAEFRSPPGDALGRVVEHLAGGRALPEDWGSTLRLTHYEDERKTEYLLGLAEDGVHVVGRESAWRPVPQQSPTAWLRRWWLPLILLVLAFGGWAWLERDSLLAYLRGEAPAAGQSSATSE